MRKGKRIKTVREVMEGQQKELRQQWAWGEVIRTQTEWKRWQMEMRKLDWAVEKSERWWRCSSNG